jgi:hypothetical protein
MVMSLSDQAAGQKGEYSGDYNFSHISAINFSYQIFFKTMDRNKFIILKLILLHEDKVERKYQ